jgi:CDP-glycerol glycerophosphotransferase
MKIFTTEVKKYISYIIIYLLNCLPIKSNKIFLFSYYGNQYGCNPMYITEHILKNYPKDKFDMVWAFNNLTNKQHLTGFRKVKTMSLRYFYELCTSKVIITNFRTTDLFVKRRSQFYIQTWHSSLRLKQIEKDAEDSLPPDYVQIAKRDSQKCDLLLSGCEFSTKIFKRAFWYDGNIFEHGTPRNDILFQNNSVMRKKILKKLNISIDSKLVLYAPTFRQDENLAVYNIDYQSVSQVFRNKFGGDWTFLVKLHPHMVSKSKQLIKGNNILDVTSFDDTQELLSIADILISDYSSLMFDFAITQRPCFLYVPDLPDYTNNDRNLYFDLKELPFISAVSNSELIKKITCFNHQEYNDSLIQFLDSIGSFEDGKACEHLLLQINEVCFSRKRKGKSYGKEAI